MRAGFEGRDPNAPIKALILIIAVKNYDGKRELNNTLD